MNSQIEGVHRSRYGERTQSFHVLNRCTYPSTALAASELHCLKFLWSHTMQVRLINHPHWWLSSGFPTFSPSGVGVRAESSALQPHGCFPLATSPHPPSFITSFFLNYYLILTALVFIAALALSLVAASRGHSSNCGAQVSHCGASFVAKHSL